MTGYDLSFEDPASNILYDEFLYECVNNGTQDECLRVWESPSVFVVLGRVSSCEEDVHYDVAAQDGVPVLRRCSGGGTVLQGPGCLNFSFILKKDKHAYINDLHASYKGILQPVLDGLRSCGVEAQFFPLSDLAVADGQKKFSGNAQRRGRNAVLHHGTILYNYDLSLISRYLRMPQKRPDYRQSRMHHDFVANIPVSKDTIISSCFLPLLDGQCWQTTLEHDIMQCFKDYCVQKDACLR